MSAIMNLHVGFLHRRRSTVLLLFVLSLVFFSAVAWAQSTKDIPNIFTPNSDGINDTFELESTEVMHFSVFNRTGMLVFQIEAKHIVWDGKDERGAELADGIYFYVLKDPAKNYKQEKGFLYISRTEVK